jgi:hypothetical protein
VLAMMFGAHWAYEELLWRFKPHGLSITLGTM